MIGPISTINEKNKILSGKVVSTSIKNTIVVLVTRYRKHPKYGKFLVRSKRLKAHDEGNACALGDTVFIKQCKPMSKDKHYMVVKRVNSTMTDNGSESEIHTTATSEA